jgi:hypothetical protein
MCSVRRGAVVIAVAWLAAAGCSRGGDSAPTPPISTSPPVTTPSVPPVPGVADRAEVRGAATLDGAAFDARWVGAVVLRSGLVTPCQQALPPIENGRYQVTVFAATESSGCGAPGAQVVLWTFAHDQILFSTEAVAWPGNGRRANFRARYSTSMPAGAAPVTAQFNGDARGRDGVPVPLGARVDAYVGRTRCGTASVRSADGFTGYSLAVVGPDAIAGCTRGAALSFRVNGRPAVGDAVVNTPPGRREALDLTAE